MISITILGSIVGAIGLVFSFSIENNAKISKSLPGPRAANGVGLYLASDISSAVPVDPDSWLDTDPASASGCAGADQGMNVLRIETRSASNPDITYVASYRYVDPVAGSTKGSLWRVFCVAGKAPSSNAKVADGIDPGDRPVAKVSDGKDSVEIVFLVWGREASAGVVAACRDARLASESLPPQDRPAPAPNCPYEVRLRASVRTVESAPEVVAGESVTIPVKPICQYTGASVDPVSRSGKDPAPAEAPVAVRVRTNQSAGGVCRSIVVKLPDLDGAVCPLTRKDGTDDWSGSCFGPESGVLWPENPRSFPVFVFDRVDDGDPKADPAQPPIDVDVPGSDVAVTVHTWVVPTAPTGVVAKPGDRSIVVSWTAPVLTPDTPAVSGYTVSSTPGTASCSTTTATVCTLTGLTNGTTYTVTVRATNRIGAGPASDPVTARPVSPFSIAGSVFEDVNYGGGAGRNRTSALAEGGVGTPGALVELYDLKDTTAFYVGATKTDGKGAYAFADPQCTACAVRVVGSTVGSQRKGWTGDLAAVPTFMTDASTTAVTDRTDMVGGTDPAGTDAAEGLSGASFDTRTGEFTAGVKGTAQSFALVNDTSGNPKTVDFGYNFDTVTNVNDSGAGSIRQVLVNAETLGGDAELAQSKRKAGVENVVFMIPNGSVGYGGSLGLSGGLRVSNNLFATKGLFGSVATVSPRSSLPILRTQMIVDARTQPGWKDHPIVEVNGAAVASGNGIGLTGGGTTVAGLIVNRFSGNAIDVTSGSDYTLQGNWIGVGAAGEGSGNGVDGISFGASAVGTQVVGGTSPSERNVISANKGYGLIVSAGSVTVTGNYIGTDPNGSAPLGNGKSGVYIGGSVTSASIGGSKTGSGNVLSGNGDYGLRIYGGSTSVQGNLIGLDASGGSAIGNANGIFVQSSTAETIGGLSTPTRNVVSGNNGYGIWLNGGSHTIVGNLIGTDATGQKPVPNKVGVYAKSSGNTIGGTAAGATNTIAGNAGSGVVVASGASGNSILRNAIRGNGALGIDLNDDGVTKNDGAIVTSGANLLTDSPVLTSGAVAGSTLTVRGYVGSASSQTAFAGNQVDVFVADNDGTGFGEGQTYLGTVSTGVNGNFSGAITVPTGVTVDSSTKLTATATDKNGNTSEFGANAPASAKTFTVSGTVFEDLNYGGGAGRPKSGASGWAAAVNGTNRPTVELYDSIGSLTATTQAATDGTYSFTNLAPDTYRVRLVTGSTPSTRTGWTAALVPVLTYQTDAASGTAVAVTNLVGGRSPALADAPANSGTQSLSALTTVSADTQAVSVVTVSGSDIGGVDFGVNFDTIVNTNDSGTGSLRQWLNNANALGGEATLAQTGRTAGVETSVFQIPTSSAGYQSGSAHWKISVASALPVMSGSKAVLDGLTQTGASAGNLWAGTPHRLTIEINGNGLSGDLLSISGTDNVARGLVLGNVNGSAVRFRGATRGSLTTSYVGLGQDGSAVLPVNSNAVVADGTSVNPMVGGASTGDGNVITGNGFNAVASEGGVAGFSVVGNFIGSNAKGSAVRGALTWAGINNISGTGTWSDIRRNLVVGAPRGIGFDGDDSISGVLGGLFTIGGNYIGVASDGVTALGNGVGIRVDGYPTGLTIGGPNAADANVIAGNTGAGVLITGNNPGIRIQQNSIWGNGTIGIDLRADGVTANDGAVTAGQPNRLLDSPVITKAGINGVNLALKGYVGNAAGQSAFAGTRVEFFVSDDDATGFGEGKIYLGYLPTGTTDGNFDGTIVVPAGVTVTPGTTKITATATDASNDTSEFGANVATTYDMSISGTVFDDVNYGGGAGRPKANAAGWLPAANGTNRATVELYDAAGAYLASTPVAADGTYSFANLAAGSYQVRLVVGTAPSGRSSWNTSLSPVLTYRVDASSGTVVDVTDHVGGEDPNAVDAAANSGTQTLGALAGSGTAVQAVAPVKLSNGSLSLVDFGVNFDAVTSTRNSGAGSLRQAITNANQLAGDNVLAVSGRTASIEHLIFMLSNGTTGSGGSANVTGGLRVAHNMFTTSAGFHNVATILPTSGLPTISTPMVIDAQAQPGWTLHPFVEVRGSSAGAVHGPTIEANDVTIRGLIVNRFAGEGITSGSGNNITIQGNWVGINAAGTGAAGDGNGGVYMSGQGNNALIGGTTAAQRNVLSSSRTYEGVSFEGGTGHVISGNYIGTDYTGANELGNATMGVWLGAPVSSVVVGGTAPGAGNVIAGNGASGVDFAGTNITVQGNRIGTNADGTVRLPNARGVYTLGGSNSTIGGSVAGAGNIISGNGATGSTADTSSGIYIANGSNISVAGNTIGLGSDGTTPIPNVRHGIYIAGTSTVTVGGPTPASRNVIAGNAFAGVSIAGTGSGSVSVQNNWIGLASDGSTSRGNGTEGVRCATATVNNCSLTTNVIAGSGTYGVYLATGTGHTLRGNFIGTDAAGLVARPNVAGGVYVVGTGVRADIGSANATDRNVISGNGGFGVRVDTAGAVNIVGNHIGVGSDGLTALGNNGAGVMLRNTGAALVGGTSSGSANVIANNSGAGVSVGPSSGSGNAILGNSIHDNTLLGIDLGTTGVSANDGLRTSGAPNLYMDAPIFTSASMSGSQLTVAGYVGSSAGQATFANDRVEVFVSDGDASGYGEGRVYIGSLNTGGSNGNFSGTLSLPSGTVVTSISATATDTLNNTSEFGPAFRLTNPVTSGLVLSLDATSTATMYQQSGGSSPVTGAGQQVCRWADTSTASNHALQPTTTMCPTFGSDALGGYVNFAANGWLNSSPTLSPDASVFVVAQSNTTPNFNTYGWIASARGANGFILHPWSGTASWGAFTVNTSGAYTAAGTEGAVSNLQNPQLYEMTMAGSNPVSGVWGRNGVTTAYTSAGVVRVAASVVLTLGADGNTLGRLGSGKYREVLVYNRALSGAELSAVETYLRTKWSTG